MATKKQKREAAEAKRAKFEAEMRELGLKAQNADRERRSQLQASYAEEARLERRRLELILIRASINNEITPDVEREIEASPKASHQDFVAEGLFKGRG